METYIQPGLFRITWESLGIIEYTHECKHRIKNLNSLFQQMEHMELDLSRRIHQITSYNLFKYRDEDANRVLPCRDFFSEIEAFRTERVCMMVIFFNNYTYYKNQDVYSNAQVKVYETFGPILKKLENLVLNTNTGRSPFMQYYYTFWENKIFQSMTTMILTNFDNFTELLKLERPLFQVDVALMEPEIVLRPTSMDVYNIVSRNVRDCLEKLKLFPRWMDETCIISPAQKVTGTSLIL